MKAKSKVVLENPFLIGKLVYLRVLSIADLEGNYKQWLNDPLLNLQNSHHVFPYTIDDLFDYIKYAYTNKDKLPLAIIDITKNKHIGNISLVNIDYINRKCDWGIIVGEKEYWNRGYAKEASYLLLRHAFDNLNIHRIYSGTTAENIGGQKLMISMGMVKEGIRREHIYKAGKFMDIFEYGVLKKEFYMKFNIIPI